jgi:pyruvate/2-oxoglutarate/acetoin dehydrogenase E1 component
MSLLDLEPQADQTGRSLSFAEAIREATEQCLALRPDVYVMGLGVNDPKAIFGTTAGLLERFGARRVFDMPTAENGMSGVGIGSALAGMRPIMIHQRVDFVLLALDQIVNNAAKWHAMFGRRANVPIVFRLIIGRGWGQGPQHSQSLQATFAHFPGLKVVMPATAYDAKGMLIAAVEDGDPVIFLEHRWLHATFGSVPAEAYRVPLDKARVARAGSDITIAATSYMTLEALKAADLLSLDGIDAEVIDVRSIKPVDAPAIVGSARKTGRFVAVDSGWRTLGFAGELVALVAEKSFATLKAAPARVCPNDVYVPTTAALADSYYPSTASIVNAVRGQFGLAPRSEADLGFDPGRRRDVPDAAFRGPF